MTEPQTLGDFIRERRLALGFSAGQLAMRLHSTAAVVRTWERGHEPVPADALPGLAELLGVDEVTMRALQPATSQDEAPSAEPVAADTPSNADSVVEAELVTSAPEPAAPEETEAMEPAADADAAPNGDRDAPAAVGHAPGLVVDSGLLDAPTEAIEPIRPAAAAAAATATRARPVTRPAPVTRPPIETASVEPAAVVVDGTVPDWLGPLRVLFDPSKRYLYWARWIGTAIGLYILLRVLGFAVDGMLEAIGDFWDSFSTPEPAGIADESGIDALAVLSSL